MSSARPLSDADRAILDFSARWYRYPGAQEQAVADELSLTATSYFRKLNDLIDRPEALAYAPSTVKRLVRMRAERTAARSAKAHGLDRSA